MSDRIDRDTGTTYLAVPHASYHVNPGREFNEINPGVGLGHNAGLRGTHIRVGAEAGRFRNSLDDHTQYLGLYAERDLLPATAPGRVWLGGFFAYAEYPSEVENAKDRGFVTLGDFVPIAGLQATFPTVGPHELRLRLTPGLEQADGIVTLQSNWRF